MALIRIFESLETIGDHLDTLQSEAKDATR